MLAVLYVNLLIALAALVVGAVISRFIQGVQMRRLADDKRTQLLEYTRRVRTYAIVPAVVAVMFFIIGIIVLPDAFAQLLRIFVFGGALYLFVFNAVIFVSYARARCSLFFFFFAILARLIMFASALFFCYLVIIVLP